MSRTADADAILTACMADLGRERQEELPLNDVSRRGPTFLPGRGTGVGHIPPKLKERLSKGWGAKIEDAESKQMEGLAVENARPWAKQSANTPSSIRSAAASASDRRHDGKSAAPRASHASHNSVKGSGVAVVKESKTPATRLQRSQQDRTSPRVGPAQIVAAPNDLNARPARSNSETNVVTSSPNIGEAQVKIVCTGQCEIVMGTDDKSTFAVDLALKANLKSSRGFLVLSAHKGVQRTHDVADLDRPTVYDEICLVACQQGKGEFRYRLRFQKAHQASRFCHYLRSLQDAYFLQATQSEASNVSTAEKKETTACGVGLQEEQTLVKVDDDISSENIGRSYAEGEILANLARNLLSFVQDILMSVCDSGACSSSRTVKDLEGLLRSGGHDLGEDFQRLVQSTLNLKLKADDLKREKTLADFPAIAALQKEATSANKGTRITYSPEDILSLECKVAPLLDRTADLCTKQEPVALPTVPPMAIKESQGIAPSKNDDQPQRNCEPRQNGSTIMEAKNERDQEPQVNSIVNPPLPSTASSTFATAKVTQAPSKPAKQTQGLANSRWATSSDSVKSSALSNQIGQSTPAPRGIERLQPAEANPPSTRKKQGLSASRWADKPDA